MEKWYHFKGHVEPNQWSGSMTLVWIRIRGSMPLNMVNIDSDPDPAIFVIELQDANKKIFVKKSFSAYYFLKVHLHHYSKTKTFGSGGSGRLTQHQYMYRWAAGRK
jgi:hypothetical protein